MGDTIHKTIRIQVWADIDEGIADAVKYLNTLPFVRTHDSCQGTIGEGGPEPYRAYVIATWPKYLEEEISKKFDIEYEGEGWGKLYPKVDSW